MKDVLRALVAKPTRRVIGLMSGTSADGVDAALIEVSGSGDKSNWELYALETIAFEPEDRAEILALQRPDATDVLPRLSRLHFRLGDVYAAACRAVVSKAGFSLEEIDMAGLHGQTVYHATRPPGLGTAGEGLKTRFVPSTLQVGSAAVLAERTGLSVVHDFRSRDVAAGGTGAPLVPYVDYLLFHAPDVARLVLNIGGIANFTALPAGGSPREVIAFDTGPGNMVIDALAEHYSDGREKLDRNGARAGTASPDAGMMTELMADEFIVRRPPKSAGREQYGRAFVDEFVKRAKAGKLSAAAALSTATSFTVRSIVEAYRLYVLPVFPVDEVIVSGGGVHNRTLMNRLGLDMAPVPVRSSVYHGLDPDAKEAVAFALLANESIHGQPANMPGVTGASHPVVLGSFVPGRTSS
jgi:anhydro-N-acetylmuramic acid kinase